MIALFEIQRIILCRLDHRDLLIKNTRVFVLLDFEFRNGFVSLVSSCFRQLLLLLEASYRGLVALQFMLRA